MFIAAEVLIFSARAPSYFWCSLAPSPALAFSVCLGCIICSVLAIAYGYFGGLPVQDVALIWLYDILNLLIVDFIKVQMFRFLNENQEVLADYIQPPQPKHEEEHATPAKGPVDIANPNALESRAEAQTTRMSEWAVNKDERISVMRQSAVGKINSTSANGLARASISGDGLNARVSLAGGVPKGSLNGSSGQNIRPYTPASKAIHRI